MTRYLSLHLSLLHVVLIHFLALATGWILPYQSQWKTALTYVGFVSVPGACSPICVPLYCLLYEDLRNENPAFIPIFAAGNAY